MRGKDKSSWGTLPAKLVAEGYAVLAIDLRGHGETLDPSGRAIGLNNLQDIDYQNMLFDVAAGHEFLAAQKGVDPERVGIIGASIGANLGLIYCARDRRVRTVVALSPGLDYKSLKPMDSMDAVDKRAIYLVACKNDTAAVQACQSLSKSGDPDGVKSVRLFDGSAHGTDLFAAQPGFDDTIVGGWLLNTIPPRR
jgi:dienelactone hydrolase